MTDTGTQRWFETEASPEAKETKTELKREANPERWYEGYSPGYLS